MVDTNQNHQHEVEKINNGLSKRYKMITFIALGIMSYFLFTEHKDHIVPFLPYLLLLACPLMHLFMHHGHHSHGSNSEKKEIK